MDLSLSLGFSSQPTAASSSPIEDYIVGGSYQGYWATDDASRLWDDFAKNTNVTDGGTVANITDKAGIGPDLGVASTTREPIWRQSDGLLEFDGTNDWLAVGGALGAATADMYFACIVETTDTDFIILQGSNSNTVGLWGTQSSSDTDISPGVGTPEIRMDGVVQSWANRGDVYTDLADGTKHVIELIGLDMTDSNFNVQTYFPGDNQRFDGKAGHFVVIDNANLDNASRADIRSQLLSFA